MFEKDRNVCKECRRIRKKDLWHAHLDNLDKQFDDWLDKIKLVPKDYPSLTEAQWLEACKHLKSKGINIRLNTNGLSDLINKKETAKEICEVVDSVSISLNAPTKEKYNEVTRPSFGEKSFDAMLKFAKECKEYGIPTKLTVVDVISEEDIEDCRKL